MARVRGLLGELFDGVHVRLHSVGGTVQVSVVHVTLLHLADSWKSVHCGEETPGLHPAEEEMLVFNAYPNIKDGSPLVLKSISSSQESNLVIKNITSSTSTLSDM